MIQIPNESLLRSASQVAITDTAGASLIQAVGAGFTPYLRQATVSNVHDTVDTMVKILSGTTVVAILPAGPKGGVPAFYGEQGIPGVAGEGFTAQALDAATIYVSLLGYKGK